MMSLKDTKIFILYILIIASAPLGASAEKELADGAFWGDMERVGTAMRARADVEYRTSDGYTPLMLASGKAPGRINAISDDASFIGIVKILIASKADINARAPNGHTALLGASYSGRTEIVRLLVRAGADVNAPEAGGMTPLMNAADQGHIEVINILVRHKANVNSSGSSGWTALMWAAARGNLDIIKILIKAGATIDATCGDGDTALDIASKRGHEEAVTFMRGLMNKEKARRAGEIVAQYNSHSFHFEVFRTSLADYKCLLVFAFWCGRRSRERKSRIRFAKRRKG